MFQPNEVKTDDSLLTSERVLNTPEERLMLAVLQEALATFQNGLYSRDPVVRHACHEVDLWVSCRSDDSLYAFATICGFLGIDADYLRAGFADLKRHASASPPEQPARKLRRERITDRRVWNGRIG